MNEEKVNAIARILNEWNPIGERDALIQDLDGYSVEAEDILWSMDLDNISVKKAVGSVLSEAFNIEVNASELDRFSAQIDAVIKQYSEK